MTDGQEVEYKIEKHSNALNDTFSLYKKGMCRYTTKRVFHLVDVYNSVEEAKQAIAVNLAKIEEEKKRKAQILFFNKEGKQL